MMNYDKLLLPKTKKHKKEYNNYVKVLNLTTKAEKYILNCVLSFDWSRRKIVESIKEIKQNGVYIYFKISMTAPRISVDYCTTDPYKEDGWNKNMSLDDKLRYIYHQMDYYTS